jgi:hypothetical protein
MAGDGKILEVMGKTDVFFRMLLTGMERFSSEVLAEVFWPAVSVSLMEMQL